jgi:hypothetical protein
MQTIATGLNRRRSSRCVGHYGVRQYRTDVADEMTEAAGINFMSAIGPKRTYRVAPHMSAFGVKRTYPFALQMSAYDPKRTSVCGR